MYYIIDNFEKKTPSNIAVETVELACGNNINVYLIETVHDLTQFIGFGKYKNNKIGNVYFRGQTSLYNGSMIPSLYRGKTRLDSITWKYNARINAAIKGKRIFRQYNRAVFEPLIQHYGVRTPYIDLVDNVWVALTQEGNGGDPYWSWYGFSSRVEWCACFVSWCADQCGYIESGVIPKFSLCSSGMEWFESRGQFMDGSYVPTSGDLIFFDWGNDGNIDHVGIVESVVDGTVYTVEGNSGDKVVRRDYPIGYEQIEGYGVACY